MLSLLVLRHAKSSWDDTALSDHDRPLNARGQSAAPRIGRLLVEEKLIPDLVLCSSAKRAKETMQAVIGEMKYAGPQRIVDELYLASPETYLSVLRQVADSPSRILVIGHNPGLEELVELLTTTHERLPTAALASISLPIERWRELTRSTRGTLNHIWRPKELD